MFRPAVETISLEAPVIPFARQKQDFNMNILKRANKATLGLKTCKQATYRVFGKNPHLIHAVPPTMLYGDIAC